MTRTFPMHEPDDGQGVMAAPGVCLICGYRLLTLEGDAYKLVCLGPPPPQGTGAQEGEMVICTGCTSLLVVSEGGLLAVPTARSWLELPLSVRTLVLSKCVQLEGAVLPPEVAPPHNFLVIPRGEQCAAAVRFRDGRILVSAQCATFEEALKLLNESKYAQLALEYQRTPRGWFSRGVLAVFPGRPVTFGPWGPEQTQRAARRRGMQCGIAEVEKLGFRTLGPPSRDWARPS
jgi:hypothetical protein